MGKRKAIIQIQNLPLCGCDTLKRHFWVYICRPLVAVKGSCHFKCHKPWINVNLSHRGRPDSWERKRKLLFNACVEMLRSLKEDLRAEHEKSINRLSNDNFRRACSLDLPRNKLQNSTQTSFLHMYPGIAVSAFANDRFLQQHTLTSIFNVVIFLY